MADRLALGDLALPAAACLGLLAGCDVGGGSSKGEPPHPPDVCARADPFARALERELQSAAAVATSDRPVGESISRFPVAVRVSGLRLDAVRIVGDDGKAIECSARWRATVSITPGRSARRVVERSVRMLPGSEASSPDLPPVVHGPADGGMTEIRESYSEQPLRTLARDISGDARSFRALWEPPKISVYGDLGFAAGRVVDRMLEKSKFVRSTKYCVARSDGQRVDCPSTAPTRIAPRRQSLRSPRERASNAAIWSTSVQARSEARRNVQ